YDEVFAPVARLEAIRIFLAFASYMGFKVYQMDVKSAFLYGKIDEEVYMSQPLGFIDPKFLKKVYKVVKAFTSVNTASTTVTTASPSRNVSVVGPSNPNLLPYANQDDSQIPSLEDIYEVPNDRIFRSASYDDQGAMADFINLESTMNVSRMPLSRIHSIHPITQLLRDPHSAVQTRSKVNKSSGAHALIEPKKIYQALKDECWVDAMQEELMNKKDERGVVVRNKASLDARGHRQEEGIDYDEVFAPVARLEAIRIFLAFA
nr:putative ribonuclease H-like domain-containing protein [Tanacetum cinerariifolium]